MRINGRPAVTVRDRGPRDPRLRQRYGREIMSYQEQPERARGLPAERTEEGAQRLRHHLPVRVTIGLSECKNDQHHFANPIAVCTSFVPSRTGYSTSMTGVRRRNRERYSWFLRIQMCSLSSTPIVVFSRQNSSPPPFLTP